MQADVCAGRAGSTGRTGRTGAAAGRSLLVWAACGTLLAGCAGNKPGGVLDLLTPYRVEVVQGNVVTQEMAARLREGLTRDQVRTLLGSPLLTDVFHADRWDYVFTIRRQGAQPQQRTVTVHFSDNQVARFDATDLPSEREFVASISTARVAAQPPRLELTEQQLAALPVPGRAVPSAAASPAAPAAASAPARTYPPLEPGEP
jgi:outer membrane protein assembly factor BamE